MQLDDRHLVSLSRTELHALIATECAQQIARHERKFSIYGSLWGGIVLAAIAGAIWLYA